MGGLVAFCQYDRNLDIYGDRGNLIEKKKKRLHKIDP